MCDPCQPTVVLRTSTVGLIKRSSLESDISERVMIPAMALRNN